ncbi:MAG: ATP-binding protein [Saccharofermentans sp.]|nr:ATP-binding protein [Saccharofermentans sp.]
MASRVRLAKVYTGYAEGLDGRIYEIETAITPGIPYFDVIGMCDSSIRESGGRIKAALITSGFDFPKGRITVSISPAYVKKTGSSFDLPIAICILLASGQLILEQGKKIYAEGELSLNGMVKGTPGASVRLNTEEVYDYCLIPEDETSSVMTDRAFMSVSHLRNITDPLIDVWYDPQTISPDIRLSEDPDDIPDLSEIKGQPKALRSVLIAASGWHNLLLLGSPGCGKSSCGKMISGIMPPMTLQEARHVMLINESIGTNNNKTIPKRPSFYIHPGITATRLTGSSAKLIPGEFSLADQGILFADELCEYKSDILDLMRIPLEEHKIRLVKDGISHEFPADFLFVGAGNPCRCGMLYETDEVCTCTPAVRKRYLGKLSGPFLDRIDLFCEMRSIKGEDLKKITSKENKELNRIMRDQVKSAWQIQEERYKDLGIRFNGRYDGADSEILRSDSKTIDYASDVAQKAGFSARGFCKLLRVGRTIADLDLRADMTIQDISEAAVYRRRI